MRKHKKIHVKLFILQGELHGFIRKEIEKILYFNIRNYSSIICKKIFNKKDKKKYENKR